MTNNLLKNKKALLLDMNSTFMFGEDRFSNSEDFSVYYKKIGGEFLADAINEIIRKVYNFLDERYPNEEYINKFPTLENAIDSVLKTIITSAEKNKIIETFSYHEHGFIPEEYIDALRKLKSKYTLSLVIDIWAPKKRWLETFEKVGILNLFSAISFSSDHGMVKPSPKPFDRIVNELDIPKEFCLVVGDSVRRDLGGAKAAGIDCILVDNAHDEYALKSFPTLIDFCNDVVT